MHLGPLFIRKLGNFIDMDKIAVLNLQMNQLCNQGTKVLSNFIARTKSVVSLNLASNDISSEGMNEIFLAMSVNESIFILDISTTDCSNRNRMNKKCMQSMKKMLIENKIMVELNLNSTSLGNIGMKVIQQTLNYQLDEAIKNEREKGSKKYGEFIKSGKEAKAEKDYSKIPKFKKEQVEEVRESLSCVNL